MFLSLDSQDFLVVNMEETVPTVQETSIKRLVVGPLDVRLHSSAVHRILKMVTCAMDHEYEPYCKPQQGWTSHANSFTMCFTGLALTIKSQPSTDRSLYCYLINFTLVSPLLGCLLLYSILPMIRNYNRLHFISSSHCYFFAQPIFQHTAVHEM